MKILIETSISDKKSTEWFKELAWNTDDVTFFSLNFLSQDAVDIWIETNLGDLRYMKRVTGVGYADQGMSYRSFMSSMDRVSAYCPNIEVVSVPSISGALEEENCLFSNGKRYILCVKDSPVPTDELIKDFGNIMLEKEIGMCVEFKELRDALGRATQINAYGMSILPYVSMVSFPKVSAGRGIPRWFMTDMFTRGKHVKWMLASGKWVLSKRADEYPKLSDMAMEAQSDLIYTKGKFGIAG